MPDNEKEYIDILKKSVYDRISLDINLLTIDEVAKTDLIKSHLDNKISSGFQDYYFSTLNNENFYLSSTDFLGNLKIGIHYRALTITSLTDLNYKKAKF